MRNYDHLFIDLDNTLWDFTVNSRMAMMHTLEHKGIMAKLESFDYFFEIYEQINKSLWSDYHSKKITKQALTVDRFSRSFQQFGITGLNWQEINSSYLEFMALETALFPETRETLTALQAKGYQMHIITNGFSEVQRKKLFNCGLSSFFTKVFISEEIQSNKPHRQIFEHALKSTNAKKNRSLMIGDNWETDIEGALKYGMDQIMFLNHDQNAIPLVIDSIRLASDCHYLQLKHLVKTYFVQNIADLIGIL